ncbi:MAG: hypothetical protein ACOY32_12670 [Thermodesulfobacteriota bacterium]
MKVFWLPLKNDGLANPQSMAGGKVKTTSYNAPPAGILAFYDSDENDQHHAAS